MHVWSRLVSCRVRPFADVGFASSKMPTGTRHHLQLKLCQAIDIAYGPMIAKMSQSYVLTCISILVVGL